MEYHMKEMFSGAHRSESTATPASSLAAPHQTSTPSAAALSYGGRDTSAKPAVVPTQALPVADLSQHAVSSSHHIHRAVEDAVAQTNNKVMYV